MNTGKQDIPTVLTIFGATGDLMQRKILPSLFDLYRKNVLPSFFRVIGFARRDLGDQTFRNHVREALRSHDPEIKQSDELEGFLNIFSYLKGNINDLESYNELKKKLEKTDEEKGICTNKLFYLSVPPELYENIFEHIKNSNLAVGCSEEEGWTRIIVEKPFGKNMETAEHLDEMLGKLFKEEQIYRIDHYLAKEMLQNILAFRFSNNVFEDSWDGKHIEKIEIKLWETLGVEKRGAFYDGVGALRDVGQNHLLQILALITMDHPKSYSPESIREKREQILSTLITPTSEFIEKSSYRAQYDGYREIEGVNKNSNTETYFKIKGFLDSPNWQDVPIIMEGGKRMRETRKEIVITFKHPTPCLCGKTTSHHKNKVTIKMEPAEEIVVDLWIKQPGLTFETEKRELNLNFREKTQKSQYTEEYGKLLLDCIYGNQTLFVSSKEVKYMWRFVDPIVHAWERGMIPLSRYTPDSIEASSESLKIDED